jgi:ABC-type dipeptide/oligopeptide/nickel transport system ATPase component
MGVLPPGIERLGGQVWLEGEELTALDDRQLRELRGRSIAYVPQNPKAALHPLRRVSTQMRTVMRDLQICVDRDEAEQRCLEALNEVRVRNPERVLRAYPHELSGGMAQRVLIAIALVGRPTVLVADEPTTGLDATVQAQVMELIELRAHELGAATLLVTHDLGVVARHCERAVIIEDGTVTEEATLEELFSAPRSDYGGQLVQAARREAAARFREEPS